MIYNLFFLKFHNLQVPSSLSRFLLLIPYGQRRISSWFPLSSDINSFAVITAIFKIYFRRPSGVILTFSIVYILNFSNFQIIKL